MIEALFHARHVIYSYELPHVRHLATRTGVGARERDWRDLLDAHRAGGLGPNLAGRAYAI